MGLAENWVTIGSPKGNLRWVRGEPTKLNYCGVVGHQSSKVLKENIRTRFLDLVVGKGKTKIPLNDWIN